MLLQDKINGIPEYVSLRSEKLEYCLLLSRIKDKQDEFVQNLILRQMLEIQPEDFQIFLRRCSVYMLPVLKNGIKSLVSDLQDWESHIKTAVRLSLIDKDSTRYCPVCTV